MKPFLKHIPGPLSFLIFFATACGGVTSRGADERSGWLISSDGVTEYSDGTPVIDDSLLISSDAPVENSLGADQIPIIDDSLPMSSQALAEGSLGADGNPVAADSLLISPADPAEASLAPDGVAVVDDGSLTSFQASTESLLAASGVSVIDDGDAGFSLSTTTGWSKSTGQGYNADYFMGRGTGNATWSFSVSPGSYRVSITWYNPGAPYNRFFSPVAPVSVISGTALLKSTTLNLTNTPSDRTDLGVGWKDLGVFKVTSPTLKVSLSAVASLYVIADAVRIERIPDSAPVVSVIDDSQAGFSLSTTTGWSKSTGQGLNADYFMGRGTGKATWSFSVSPGSYRVSITWYNAGAPYNRFFSSAAPVSVSSGTALLKSTTLDETTTPSDRIGLGVGWKDLGVFNVTSSSLQVSLSAVASLYVIADAVRIERMDGGAIAPRIASTIPLDSPLLGGIPVNIFGSEFVSGSQVLFGTNPSPQVSFVSSTQLIAVAPPNAPGVFDITVITPQGLTGGLLAKFRYALGRTLDDGEPGFDATAPASVAVGAGFQNDYVYPGGTNRAATASWTIPVRTQKPQEIAVTWHNAGAPFNVFFSNDVRFDVMDGTTLLKSVPGNLQTTPNSFTDQGVGWLLLGNFAFTSGQATVVLRNNTAKRLMADAIRVEELFPAPIISSVDLAAGGLAGETSVLLTGSQFLPGATVMFGNVPTSVTFIDGTSLKATASSDLIGTDLINVTNPDGQKSKAVSFTF